MSPTVFKIKGYRFFFFSREESRIHVHVHCADGEAKYWIEPDISLARNHGIADHQLSEICDIISERKEEIVNAWHRHFGS